MEVRGVSLEEMEPRGPRPDKPDSRVGTCSGGPGGGMLSGHRVQRPRPGQGSRVAWSFQGCDASTQAGPAACTGGLAATAEHRRQGWPAWHAPPPRLGGAGLLPPPPSTSRRWAHLLQLADDGGQGQQLLHVASEAAHGGLQGLQLVGQLGDLLLLRLQLLQEGRHIGDGLGLGAARAGQHGGDRQESHDAPAVWAGTGEERGRQALLSDTCRARKARPRRGACRLRWRGSWRRRACARSVAGMPRLHRPRCLLLAIETEAYKTSTQQ